MLSPRTVDLLDISNSSGKGVMIKATEVKVIVALRMAHPLFFWFTVKEIPPQQPCLSPLCVYLMCSHWVLPYLKYLQVTNTQEILGLVGFHLTSNLVTACKLQVYLDFCGENHRTGTF